MNTKLTVNTNLAMAVKQSNIEEMNPFLARPINPSNDVGLFVKTCPFTGSPQIIFLGTGEESCGNAFNPSSRFYDLKYVDIDEIKVTAT